MTRKVEVVAPVPSASFEAFTQTPKPGEEVTFNGGESVDPTGLCSSGGCIPTHQLKSYTWNFGDGRTETTTGPEYTRSFSNTSSQPRQETVTLTVTNKEGVQSAPTGQTLTIQGTPEEHKEPVKEPIKEALKEVPVVKPPVTPPPAPKPLTNAQKLAKALKACKKIRAKKTRASCERTAHKKYSSKPKSKSKTKLKRK